MCFSANASFGASVLLTSIGIVALNKIKEPSQMMFASIPLLFGIQQMSEGFLWLTLSHTTPNWVQPVTTYIFLFFAQLAWPLYIPLAIFLIERNVKNKNVLKLFIASGSIVSLYFAVCLLRYPVEVQIIGNHISYEQKYPDELRNYGGLLYIISSIAPPFFSSVKRMWSIGTAILISYIATKIFYNDYVVSVWCFFASIISIAVLHVLTNMIKNARAPLVSVSPTMHLNTSQL